MEKGINDKSSRIAVAGRKPSLSLDKTTPKVELHPHAESLKNFHTSKNEILQWKGKPKRLYSQNELK